MNENNTRSLLRNWMMAATAAAGIAVMAPATASANYSVPYGATAESDALWNETWTPQNITGANNGCIPSSAHPHPVILVHATFADEGSNWVTLAPLLANAGYCVYAFNYGATALSFCDPVLGCNVDGLDHIVNSAQQLSNFVNQVRSKTGASKVDLVGHSQGGMMPHYYIRSLDGAQYVNKLIALSPSNHGTTLSGLTNLANVFPWAVDLITSLIGDLGAPGLTDQEIGSPFIQNLFGAGDPLNSAIQYVVIQTTHDEVVTPYTNAFLSGGSNVHNITIQNQCPNDPVAHIGMFDDSPALQNVLNWLSNSPNPSFVATCTNYGQSF